MHHEFAGGCHIENNNEHERSFSAPSFSPFHQEQQGCFREMQNSRFGGVSVHLPEITINIGGGEPPCMPGFERHIPGPPGFYSMPPELGGGYVFGPRFANPGYDPNYAYEGGNPNFANPNTAYDSNNQNFNGAPTDNGQYPGPNGTYSDNTTTGATGDTTAPQPVPSGNGDTPNLVESSYNDPGVDIPHSNYGNGQDAPANPAPAAQSGAAQDAPITPTVAQSADPAAGQTQDNNLPTTAAAGDVVSDGQEIANELAANKPLGLADIGYYLSSAETNSTSIDQTTNPAAAPIDQTNTPAISTADQTNTPAATSLDQTNNPAAAPIDQTNTPAITTVDQTNNPAVSTADQTNTPAATPTDNTQNQSENSLSIPNIYDVPDLRTN